MLSLPKSAKEPVSDTRSAERWLATLARQDPLLAHGEIVRQLRGLAQPTARRNLAELDALFYVDATVERTREDLVAQYIGHAGRSEQVEHQLWQAMLDLAHAFELAYAAFAREIRRRAHDPRWQAYLPGVIVRHMRQLAFEARIRMFRYEPWIPGKWRELHDLFTLACAHQIQRERVSVAETIKTTTVQRQYICILILQLANAGNLKPTHVEWLWRQLEDWCATLKLRISARSPTAWFVDLGEARGLSRRTKGAAAGEVLFLDTRPLSSLLRHYIVAVEDKIRSHPLSPNTARRVERLAVLTKVAAQVEGQFRPVARRGERTSATGEVEVIVGFDKICSYLRQVERTPVPELDTVSSFSGTLDLAIFGRLRNADAQRADLARRRLAQYAAGGGPWEIKDVSTTGLRLLAPLTAAHSVTLGTLTALREVGQSVWTLGIVRRIRRLTTDRAEVGVQRIADTISAVELVAQRPAIAGDADAAASTEERCLNALYLALEAPARKSAVQSLIFPRLEEGANPRLRLRTQSAAAAIRFGRTIEEQPDWVWVAVEPLAAPRTRAEHPAGIARHAT